MLFVQCAHIGTGLWQRRWWSEGVLGLFPVAGRESYGDNGGDFKNRAERLSLQCLECIFDSNCYSSKSARPQTQHFYLWEFVQRRKSNKRAETEHKDVHCSII